MCYNNSEFEIRVIILGYLLILLRSLTYNIEGVFVRGYGKKYGEGGLFFNAIISFFSMIYFIVSDRNGLNFPPELWFYGLISCVFFAVGFYSMYAAYQYGSYIMTRMVSSFSMIIPLVYGLAFLKEPSTIFTYIGVFLIFASLIVRNLGPDEKKEEKKTEGKFGKWLLHVMLTTVANGFISVISKIQQVRFDDQCTNEFLVISLGGSFLALLIASFFKERNQMGYIIKHGTGFGLCAGVCNGITNILNVAVYLFLPVSLVTPLASGVSFVISFLFTVFLYKEKFTKMQLAGMFLGIAAIVVLNI